MDWFQRVLEVPLIAFLGPKPVDPKNPAAGVSLLVTEQALNAAGVLHGGVIATVLDLADE
jgi:acyl-coenzyme A thioesterase PaaI-like protein